MTTLLGIIDKLPPRVVASRPRLQLDLAWAHILLQHSAPANAALNRFEAAVDGAEPSRRAGGATCGSRRRARCCGDTRRPGRRRGRACRRGDVASRHAASAGGGGGGKRRGVRRDLPFEFDEARRLLEWAAPYQEMMGPFASVYAYCYGGIAARYQLDIERADDSVKASGSVRVGTAFPRCAACGRAARPGAVRDRRVGRSDAPSRRELSARGRRRWRRLPGGKVRRRRENQSGSW